MYPDGYPLLDSAGNVDMLVVEQMARFHEIALDPSPISDHRPDLMTAIRARNPGISVLAYVPAQAYWWLRETPDSTVDYTTRMTHLLRDHDGFLRDRAGERYSTWVNVAQHDATGRFVLAEALVDLWYDAIARTGLWDGFFLDMFCDGILWTQTPEDSIDFARAGYPDAASFDAAWQAASDTISNRLRRLCGPGSVLVGNCASGTRYETFNGWMRENFPLPAGRRLVPEHVPRGRRLLRRRGRLPPADPQLHLHRAGGRRPLLGHERAEGALRTRQRRAGDGFRGVRPVGQGPEDRALPPLVVRRVRRGPRHRRGKRERRAHRAGSGPPPAATTR